MKYIRTHFDFKTNRSFSFQTWRMNSSRRKRKKWEEKVILSWKHSHSTWLFSSFLFEETFLAETPFFLFQEFFRTKCPFFLPLTTFSLFSLSLSLSLSLFSLSLFLSSSSTFSGSFSPSPLSPSGLIFVTPETHLYSSSSHLFKQSFHLLIFSSATSHPSCSSSFFSSFSPFSSSSQPFLENSLLLLEYGFLFCGGRELNVKSESFKWFSSFIPHLNQKTIFALTSITKRWKKKKTEEESFSFVCSEWELQRERERKLFFLDSREGQVHVKSDMTSSSLFLSHSLSLSLSLFVVLSFFPYYTFTVYFCSLLSSLHYSPHPIKEKNPRKRNQRKLQRWARCTERTTFLCLSLSLSLFLSNSFHSLSSLFVRSILWRKYISRKEDPDEMKRMKSSVIHSWIARLLRLVESVTISNDRVSFSFSLFWNCTEVHKERERERKENFERKREKDRGWRILREKVSNADFTFHLAIKFCFLNPSDYSLSFFLFLSLFFTWDWISVFFWFHERKNIITFT